jgi:polysaccharide export outer membrane protein
MLQVLALLTAIVSGPSCSAPGKYVWVDAYRDGAADRERPYAIGPGDVIQVRVFNQDHLSTRTRVRGDGKISLPLLNDVPAVGLTPVALAGDLQMRFKEFVKAPVVTVSLEEARPLTIYVTGEVGRPGVYPLESATGVLQALVNAGGVTVNAHTDRIFVLRQGAEATRIRFKYDALTRLEGSAASFRLRPGDIVVVE